MALSINTILALEEQLQKEKPALADILEFTEYWDELEWDRHLMNVGYLEGYYANKMVLALLILEAEGY